MKISEIQQWLEPRGLRLTRALGQNFLHDANQLERIVRMADVRSGDAVLEIGPGLGALTERLLDAGAKVTALEKDRRLADCLRERLGKRQGLEVVTVDALVHLRLGHQDWRDWKMVSNLPYSVASPILVEIGLMANRPSQVVATVQWEVGQRLMAVPGRPEYGLLSLFVQLGYKPDSSFRIPATCFFPAPEVASSCVRLLRREAPLLPEPLVPVFTALIKRAFSQRRKVMWKLLRADWPETALEEARERLELPRDIRAERVSLDQFVALTTHLSG